MTCNTKKILAIFIQILLLSTVFAGQQKSPKIETHEFSTQVSRMMDILINSLYTQKQIFLRQVISNASDALDKIRFMALTQPEILGDKKQLQIRISINEQQKYLSIRDTGIGMTKQQLIDNLGTIAKTGTTSFLQALKGGNINLIGQFGVGFYSTFLAGSKIEVITKSVTEDQYIWVSESAASYSIEKDPNGNTLGRGTEVRIYVKQNSLQYLKHRKIDKLVRKYSEFIDFPIYLNNKKEIEVDAEPTQQKDEDIQIKEQNQNKQPKKVTKTVFEWEKINTQKALWLREKEDIYQQDYIDFFKTLSKQSNPPMNWIHFNTEGQVVFNSIIYIPNRAPYDFYANYNTRKNDLKLYVRRVLITEQNADMIPKYLSFVSGVIDSDDLPLKVDRQTLVQSKAFKIINQKLTKKILDMITEISKWDYIDEDEYEEDYQEDQQGSQENSDDALTQEQLAAKKEKARSQLLQKNKERYNRFYRQFGKAIKLGILQDKNNRLKLASLARWHTTKNSSQLHSLDQYIKRMKPIQDQIYFFSGQDKQVLERSPLVVGLVRKGYEVLLCDDPIDQYVFNVLREFDGKNMVNVGKGDFKMPEDDQFARKQQKYLTKMYQPFTDYAKKILFEKVADVQISNRLTTEPCVVIADSYGHSSFMDKIQKAQTFGSQKHDAPSNRFKKILQINPHHKMIQMILEKIKNQQTNEQLEQLVSLLFETAAFNSGFSVSDPNQFVHRFYKTYSKAMGVLSLQRNQLQVEDIELQSQDVDEPNQQFMRVNPEDIMTTEGDSQ